MSKKAPEKTENVKQTEQAKKEIIPLAKDDKRTFDTTNLVQEVVKDSHFVSNEDLENGVSGYIVEVIEIYNDKSKRNMLHLVLERENDLIILPSNKGIEVLFPYVKEHPLVSVQKTGTISGKTDNKKYNVYTIKRFKTN